MKYKPYNLKDVVKASEQEKFTVISTFAGGGGSSTGYRLAGGKILCINEFVRTFNLDVANPVRMHQLMADLAA